MFTRMAYPPALGCVASTDPQAVRGTVRDDSSVFEKNSRDSIPATMVTRIIHWRFLEKTWVDIAKPRRSTGAKEGFCILAMVITKIRAQSSAGFPMRGCKRFFKSLRIGLINCFFIP